jgi:hypothetical protein
MTYTTDSLLESESQKNILEHAAEGINKSCLSLQIHLFSMPNLKPPKLEVAPAEEESLEPIPSHPTWSGSISIALVNIPVRAIPITLERKISF